MKKTIGAFALSVAALFGATGVANANPNGHLGDGDASAYAADIGIPNRLKAYEVGQGICDMHRQGWTPGDVASDLNIKVAGLSYSAALVMVRKAEFHFCPEMINWSDPDLRPWTPPQPVLTR